MAHEDNPADLEGGWFSTGDLKLAVALSTAGFPLRNGSEVTRIVLADGRESFTWHFRTVTATGVEISTILPLWDEPSQDEYPTDPRTIFLCAREAMLERVHILTESHKVPAGAVGERDGKKIFFTPKLGRKEREQLARMAS